GTKSASFAPNHDTRKSATHLRDRWHQSSGLPCDDFLRCLSCNSRRRRSRSLGCKHGLVLTLHSALANADLNLRACWAASSRVEYVVPLESRSISGTNIRSLDLLSNLHTLRPLREPRQC